MNTHEFRLMFVFFSSVLPSASWKTFCVIQSGITNDTHVEFVKMIKSHGHTEVTDPEECDYCLLFCPITSRVGTDVELALRKIPGEK